MEDIKTFNHGLNSDISPVSQQDDTYVDALNIELINDELQGSVSVSNSKGNKFQTDLWNTSRIQKVTLITPSNTNITIDGQTGSGVVMSTIKDLYDYITTDPAYTYLTVKYDIYYSGLNILFYPKRSFDLAISVGPGLTLDTNYIPAQDNLQVIGYGIIRNDIYLFTTNTKTTDPKNDPNEGYGFIWRLNYNNITFNSTDASLKLIYAGKLNFSTYWNIPQTGVVGRYENDLIQRLYWTDNYNRLRSINVADPQIGALDISLIDVTPSVAMDIPILKNITSAQGTAEIEIGCYQLAYKLSNTSGSTTQFSIPSNPVFVVNAAEDNQNSITNWKDYHGDVRGTKTTKRITWKINTLDRNFERIEAVVLFRDSKNSVPTITSFFNSIVNSDSIEITLDGNILESNNTTVVTLDEFNSLAALFTNCKTIGTKDNRLLLGNVRNELNEISDLEYDSRAYRFSALNSFKLINNKGLGVVTYTAPGDYTNIKDTSDAINPFNLLDTDPQYNNTVKYKADGTTIGGEGPNISYEFISMAVKADDNCNLSDPQPLPLFSTSPSNVTDRLSLNVYSRDKNNTDILQEYTNNFPTKINDGTKYPQMNSVLWGYQNNEIYRFGIQFYDKQKNPYTVKWIADIKFPDYFDTCLETNVIKEDNTPVGALQDHRIVFTPGVNSETYTMQLGIRFKVKIPANLTKKISGYSIVRVKREENDKTVIAEGIISNKMRDDGGGSYGLLAGSLSYNSANTNSNRLQFITPNMLDSSLAQPSSGMKLIISTVLNPSNSNTIVDIVGGNGPNKNFIYKLYNHLNGSSVGVLPYKANIAYSNLMGLNGVITYQSETYNNKRSSNSNNGNPAYLLIVDGVGISTNTLSDTQKLLAYIYNPIINQYNGNTYVNRGDNEYILCNHYRSIKTSSTDYNDNFILFGGDVINGIMDEERVSKNYSEITANSTTFLYPSKSPVNRELRHGRHPNVSLTDIFTTNQERTDYFYNTVYSTQNDIVKLYPKPADFISIANYDNRFYISEIKINGELNDSWSSFKANNYWDVDGTLGPINSCLLLGDKMYFWQDRGFGIIEINPRTLINDANSSTNSQITTGTGLPLQRHEYISTVVGTKHQGSTISSSGKLFWFDVNTKKIYTYSQGGETPFSDIEGMYSFLNKNITGNIQNIDKPTYKSEGTNPIGINGVVATYDYKRHKAIFTFHSGVNTGVGTASQNSFTIVINELLNAFTTRHSFIPRIYINDYKYIFSTNNNAGNDPSLRNIYIHDRGNYCEYYTIIYPTYIKFIVNDNPAITKVFDNIKYDSQVRIYDSFNKIYTNVNTDTWSRIRITNDYQNTDFQDLLSGDNIKRRERTWMLAIPRNRVLYTTSNSPNIYTDLSVGNKPFGERIRDKYIQVELEYSNVNSNREIILNNFRTSYRLSAR